MLTKNKTKYSLKNYMANFKKKIGTNAPLVTLYQDCSNYIDTLRKMVTRGQGHFPFWKIFLSKTAGPIR